ARGAESRSRSRHRGPPGGFGAGEAASLLLERAPRVARRQLPPRGDAELDRERTKGAEDPRHSTLDPRASGHEVHGQARRRAGLRNPEDQSAPPVVERGGDAFDPSGLSLHGHLPDQMARGTEDREPTNDALLDLT